MLVIQLLRVTSHYQATFTKKYVLIVTPHKVTSIAQLFFARVALAKIALISSPLAECA